ncbi:MAG: hypothetical protein ACRBCI_07195 [Cellvibrionaceae bacterium]
MPELLFCSTSQPANVLQRDLNIKPEMLFDKRGQSPTIVSANKPYLITPKLTSQDIAIVNRLSNIQASRDITSLVKTLGPENTVAASDITAKLHEYNLGLVGASTSIYSGRVSDFGGAVQKYQASLLNYRDVMKGNGVDKAAAKLKVQQAFNSMQSKFHHELKGINNISRARRGTPLSSSRRGINIARSSRNATKLHISNTVQATNLVKFSQHTKILGNGLAVIDFGSRIGNVHNAYKAGGNWERDLFIESSSFAASAYTGVVAANAGAAALGFLMVATPIGWVGLIVAGVVIAGTTAGASIAVNNYVKDNAGSRYDQLMKLL